MEDEEEVESPAERQQRVTQMKKIKIVICNSNLLKEHRIIKNHLKTVPQKESIKNYNTEERNYRMGHTSNKSNSKMLLL